MAEMPRVEIPAIIHLDRILMFCSVDHAEEHEHFMGYINTVNQLDAPHRCATCSAPLPWLRWNIFTHQIDLVPADAEDWEALF